MGKLQTRLIIAFAITIYILADTVEAGVVDRVRKDLLLFIIPNFVWNEKLLFSMV